VSMKNGYTGQERARLCGPRWGGDLGAGQAIRPVLHMPPNHGWLVHHPRERVHLRTARLLPRRPQQTTAPICPTGRKYACIATHHRPNRSLSPPSVLDFFPVDTFSPLPPPAARTGCVTSPISRRPLVAMPLTQQPLLRVLRSSPRPAEKCNSHLHRGS